MTRDISGSTWTMTTALTLSSPAADLGTQFLGGDLFLSAGDYDAGDLLLGSRSGSYSMTAINETPGDFVCQSHVLSTVDGRLATPSADEVNDDLYAFTNDGTDWQREIVFPNFGTVSRMDAATFDDTMLITFIVPSTSRWYYCYFDGSTWSFSSIVTLPETPLSELRPVCLEDGTPYIIFEDSTGQLKGASGFYL
ncbi:MAG: hypothetical protein M3R04_09820, partial [bacterium]|nr:hypothetical protein [bacterium]